MSEAYQEFIHTITRIYREKGMARIGVKNGWFQYGPLEVYIRVSPHFIAHLPDKERSVFCVCVANATVPEEERGKGVFTQWIEELEDLCSEIKLPIWIENVLNERLLGFFPKRGYQRADCWGNPCFYLPSPTNQTKAVPE